TLQLPAVSCLLIERDTLPPLLDELAVAIDGLVPEVPPIERVVQLERDQVLAGRAWVGTEQVDAGLLAVLQRFQMCFDESLVEEMLERFVSQRDAPSGSGSERTNRVPEGARGS